LSTATVNDNPVAWKETPWIWASIFLVAALLGFIFYDGLKELVKVWGEKEEYSYGYLIPFIALFLVWQKKDRLQRISFPGTWWGVFLTFLGIGFFVVGSLGTFYHIIQYSFLIVLTGAVLSFTGRQGFRVLWIPLLFLFFMIPLPGFVLAKISTELQLMSSQIGVWVIRSFGISVFLEGNVIDLGTMKLQVVEACSGLRYLFPLMTLAFIAAYFYREKFWKRAVIFLSSIPITIFMNSFRIGAIGVLVEYWGKSMAEGFLHDFEGWAVFMACTAMLVLEMWLLTRVGGNRRPLSEVFGIEFPVPIPGDVPVRRRSLPRPYLGAMLIILVASMVAIALPHRVEAVPSRLELSRFPLSLEGWQGRTATIEQMYLDILKLDDYILADFVDRDQRMVNFYVAYYASQSKGNSSHSPSTCIPGGGWTITSLTQQSLEGVVVNGNALRVNRAVIEKGGNRQLVYYWFKERDRIVTDEIVVRLYIFWDALTRNRSDGALVRLVTVVKPGESIGDADKRLVDFVKLTNEPLKSYLPD
jgi:exosortase D (VPLPA-CTERM-specific)